MLSLYRYFISGYASMASGYAIIARPVIGRPTNTYVTGHRYTTHLHCLDVQAAFYNKVEECWISVRGEIALISDQDRPEEILFAWCIWHPTRGFKSGYWQMKPRGRYKSKIASQAGHLVSMSATSCLLGFAMHQQSFKC